ncbi:MAG TPA: tetratricopeptide repeat protein [Phycisphaerae bacterium]|nr:tetratricopeptide repeat protein [Phycisphaerae bacterium]
MLQDATNNRPRGARSATAVAEPEKPNDALKLLRRYYEAQQQLRRGICLLNAGQYDRAAEAFTTAGRLNPHSRPLPWLLAACHAGQGRYDLAAVEMERQTRTEPTDVTAQIRRALLLWQDSRPHDAIEYLRQSVVAHPDSAELQFQLGTLLAAMEEYAEAELRFTQAIAMDKEHADALIALAQCCAVRQQVREAKRYLERAQHRRAGDARVGLLLAQAAKSLSDQGTPVTIQARIPEEQSDQNTEGLEQLSRIVEADPEFIDAFVGLPTGELDGEVHGMFSDALDRALKRNPKHVGLHCAAGRLFAEMGRPDEAIRSTRSAVQIDPQNIQALVQLGRLYQQSHRDTEAIACLNQAIAMGAKYADVYYLLGNLYRRSGQAEQARRAYVRALKINKNYQAARTALETLAA